MKKDKAGGRTPPYRSPMSEHDLGFLPSPSAVPDANMDRHRARFTGGKLFMRELVYRVQLEGQEKLILPRVRLEVRDDPPSWLPPRRTRRRKRDSPIPNLSRSQYLRSKRLREWMRHIVEIAAGYRGHERLTLIQEPADHPLEWRGRCDLCGAGLHITGTWTAENLPRMTGKVFLDSCERTIPISNQTVVVTPRKPPVSVNRFRLIPRPVSPKK